MSNGSTGAKGPANIVDRLGIGSLPIGIESFADIVSSFVYVDKTLLAAELIDRRGVTLFHRPRRFGKSTALRMLQCFFEAPVEGWIENDPGLFDGLAIMGSEERHVAQQGAHPVIYLGLNSCGGDTWEAMRASIARVVADELGRHAYLLDSPRLSPVDRRVFERVWSEEGSDEDLQGSLVRLAKLLRAHHHSQVVILIVEPEAARAHALPAIVTEVKFRADASHDELAVVAHATLADQAMRKRYAHGLVGHGAILWSVAFDAHKHVAVARA